VGERTKSWIRNWGLIFLLAAIKLLIHFITNSNYEIHRDALLYISLGDHPAVGYLSVPPSIAFFANISRFLFGDTNFAIRFFPAIIGALAVVIIGLIVKEFKGKNTAILIACLAYIVSPAFLRSNTLLQPVSFNQVYWLLSCFFIIKLINTRNPRIWIWIGIVFGLAFLNKYSILFFIAAFFIALLITSHRKFLRSRYFYMGMFIGLIIALPNILWQFTHSLPIIDHMRELQQTQLVNVDIGGFVLAQFLMNLPGVIVWLFGLIFLLFLKDAKEYRILGFIFIFTLGMLILLKGKPYYTLGIYPVLFAAGGYAIEKYLSGKMAFLRYLIIVLMIGSALPIIPYSLPVLKMDKMAEYFQSSKMYGMEGALRWEDGEIHELPQDYADMVGWIELTEIVADTYHKLNIEEKDRCYIFTDNYGEAGAINYYGKKYDLPDPLSFNGSFMFWTPDELPLDVIIIYVGDNESLPELFKRITKVGYLTNQYARESGLPVYLCKEPTDELFNTWNNRIQEIKSTYH